MYSNVAPVCSVFLVVWKVERLQQGICAEGSLFVLTHNFLLLLLIMLILCFTKILTYSIGVPQAVCKAERSKITRVVIPSFVIKN